MDITEFRKRIQKLPAAPAVPSYGYFENLIRDAITVLQSESAAYRPHAANGRPGGLLQFTDALPFVIVPDLHARIDFFSSLLEFQLPDGSGSVLERIAAGSLRLLCLGDILHTERNTKARWNEACENWIAGNAVNRAMSEEMTAGLNLSAMIMECKTAFPEMFHCLKGNHENIMNTAENGAHPFRKYVFEGDMVRDFVTECYDGKLLRSYADYENSLPVFVCAPRFLASHAEPRRFYKHKELVETWCNPDVIEGLTWTENGASKTGSVKKMLKKYLGGVPDALYFGGHRTISGMYELRADGRFVQLHNPDAWRIAYVSALEPFDPEKCIYTVGGL